MKLIPLAQAPLTVKVLITSFLLVLSFGNIAAGVYTQKYVGISYESLVETYSEKSFGDVLRGGDVHNMHSGSGKTDEIPIELNDIPEMPHHVDLKLLLQDAHVHLFSHGVLSLLTGVILLLTGLSDKWKIVLIPLPFIGGSLDFASMFLVKYVADGFAYLIIFSGMLTGLSFMIVFLVSIYEMWFAVNK